MVTIKKSFTAIIKYSMAKLNFSLSHRLFLRNTLIFIQLKQSWINKQNQNFKLLRLRKNNVNKGEKCFSKIIEKLFEMPNLF